MQNAPFVNWLVVEKLQQAITDFNDLLTIEKDALSHQKIDDIIQVAEQKNASVEKINTLVAELYPFSFDDIRHAANTSNQLILINNVLTLSEQAAQHNERNQVLLATLYKLNSQLLNQLNQHQTMPFQGYSQTGLPKSNNANRSLGKA
ncbi:hypothetical protein [Thiomicrospira sp. ALE5]|uniref:hypothetical protein n=1 Tax=Thiomicrospira sp. ALE5 TaxID=748650 RepID=UPI0008E6B2E4|nr:hypothetical protein [Thiomicrospira sp. ALE5]SFR60159.1 hypothetical protein SAMN03092900_1580 [Thiomicrospira sp. ALE5]